MKQCCAVLFIVLGALSGCHTVPGPVEGSSPTAYIDATSTPAPPTATRSGENSLSPVETPTMTAFHSALATPTADNPTVIPTQPDSTSTPRPVPTVDHLERALQSAPASVVSVEREGLPGYRLVQVTQYPWMISPGGIAYVAWMSGGDLLEVGFVTDAGGGGPGHMCFTTGLIDLASQAIWLVENESCFYGWTSKSILYRRAASPDGTMLAFAERDSVRIVDVLSHEQVSIPINCGPTVCPAMAFSPDSTRLAITSQEGIHVLDPTGGTQVYQQPVEGAFLHDISWSPDGQKLAYYDEVYEDCSLCQTGDGCFSPVGSFRVTILDVGTGAVRHSPSMETWLSDCIGEGFYLFAPQWLAEGDQLLAPTAGGGLWIWDLVSDEWRQASGSMDVHWASTQVSPDGNQVAFEQGEEQQGYIYDVATHQATLATWQGKPVSWSPSGKEIALLRWDGEDNVGLLVQAETGSLLASFPPFWCSPVWAPDGQSFVYLADDTIWLANADGQNPRRLVPEDWIVASAPLHLEDWKPQWSPSGTRLAFLGVNRHPEHISHVDAYFIEFEGSEK